MCWSLHTTRMCLQSPYNSHLTRTLQTEALKTWYIVLALWKDFFVLVPYGVLHHINDKVLFIFNLKGVFFA